MERVWDEFLAPWDRWATDDHGEQLVAWDDPGHTQWSRKWAPQCLDRKPRRIRRALGFRERNVSELELRVALGGDHEGVCQVVVDEHESESEVYVRLFVHYERGVQLNDGRAPATISIPRSACGWSGRSGSEL